MGQQRTTEKSPLKELKDVDEMEATQIPDTEFKIMAIRYPM